MNKRTVLAFLVAPVSFGLLLLVVWTPFGTLGLVAVGMSALIGYPLALLIGLPIYFVMQKIGANSLLSYGIVGLIFSGILICSLVLYPIHAENNGDISTLLSSVRITQMSFLIFGSYFTLFVFWLIARADRTE